MKRAFFSFLLFAFVAIAANAQILKGDMNDDGAVDVSDVTVTVSTILGNTPLQTINLSSNPYEVDNSLVVGTWYAPDGTSFAFNEDGTTTFPGGATYEFYPFQGRLLVFNASGAPMQVIPLVKVQPEYLLAVNYATGAFTYYTNEGSLATGITISQTTLDMISGTTAQLTATITPEDAYNPVITWTSSDESVATVDANGLVTAVAGGTATITATASGSNVKATCSVSVTQMVTSIVLSQTKAVLGLDESVTLTTTVLPETASNRIVTWSSSNEDIAYVRNGKVVPFNYGMAIITCEAADGSGVKATCKVNVIGTVNLGLPSGTLWATCNIGAESPEDYGDYFAWGETEGYNEGKTNFDWSTYFDTEDYGSTFKMFDNGGGFNVLGLAVDAAYVNWGSNWRMPSWEQFAELINSEYTTTQWTTQNGVNGRKITSKSNGNSIFLPTAGWRYGGSLRFAGSYGYYWLNSLSVDPTSRSAWGLYFDSGRIEHSCNERCYGQSVRPVCLSEAVPVQLVTDITLDYTSLELKVNDEQVLVATVSPSDADNPAVVWSSIDKSVAEVNQSGLVTAKGAGSCVITCAATDGSGVTATCSVVVSSVSGTIDGRDYVDLGLPSGTLWATCNVGAESPEDYGDYFAWGETEGYNDGKTDFSWSTYKWCNGDYNKQTKYCNQSSIGNNGFTDNLIELELADDAAYVNWGINWCMPSQEQFDELINSEYTIKRWTTQNGVNGRKIISRSNGCSIFLPAAGYYYESSLGGMDSGYYWSRTLSTSGPDDAWYLRFDSPYDVYTEYYDRFYGQSVRPVRLSE